MKRYRVANDDMNIVLLPVTYRKKGVLIVDDSNSQEMF